MYPWMNELCRFLESNPKFDVDKRHFLGWTALHVAAVNGRVDMIRLLLESGADLNAGDDYVNVYRTASEKGLHTLDGELISYDRKTAIGFSWKKYIPAISQFFPVMLHRESEFSESLRAQENYLGFTALHYAVLVECTDCVKLLLAKGANPNIEASGHTPVALAKDAEMKTLLESEVEKVSSK